jgi:hypothetical protein
MAVRDQPASELDMAKVEDLDLGFCPRPARHVGHRAQMGRRVEERVFAEVHGGDVERADLGPQRLDVAGSLGRGLEIRALAADSRIVETWHEPPARAGGQIQDDVPVLLTNSLDDLAIEGEFHARLRGRGIAHVDVDDSRSGLGRFQGRTCDLDGRDRHGRVLGTGIGPPGQRACYDDRVRHECLRGTGSAAFHAADLAHRLLEREQPPVAVPEEIVGRAATPVEEAAARHHAGATLGQQRIERV